MILSYKYCFILEYHIFVLNTQKVLTYLMPKIPKTVTINQDLLDWINQKIEEKEFASLSHAVEKGLYQLKKNYEQSK